MSPIVCKDCVHAKALDQEAVCIIATVEGVRTAHWLVEEDHVVQIVRTACGLVFTADSPALQGDSSSGAEQQPYKLQAAGSSPAYPTTQWKRPLAGPFHVLGGATNIPKNSEGA